VSDGFSGGLAFNFKVIDLELCLQDLLGMASTLVSSQKSANMPEVARIVLSVNCTNLLSFRVTML